MAFISPSESNCGMSSQPPPAMVTMLTETWLSVLKRSSIGIEDNFFRTGGSVASADLLFAEISHRLGRELPTATIFRAPTIAALASLLDQPELPRFLPFVQLKAGNQKTPIIISHGLDGRASFSGLAKRIQTDHPIYGIQAKGVDGLEEPLDRIEDMAQFYLDALNELQSHGPYILIGYSFGGLVALEMAHRLSEHKKDVGLLVLVDAYPHPRYLSVGQRLRLSAQRTKKHLSAMKQRTMRGAFSYLWGELERRLRDAAINTRGAGSLKAARLSLAHTTLQVKRQAYAALASYRPRPYSGKIKFVKSETDTYFPGDPFPVWAHLADGFEVETVRGSHLNMVTTHFEGLATVLTRYVVEAVGP